MTGSDGSKFYQSNWSLYSSLSFLEDVRTPNESKGNLSCLFSKKSNEINKEVTQEKDQVNGKIMAKNKSNNFFSLVHEKSEVIPKDEKLIFNAGLLEIAKKFQDVSENLKNARGHTIVMKKADKKYI